MIDDEDCTTGKVLLTWIAMYNKLQPLPVFPVFRDHLSYETIFEKVGSILLSACLFVRLSVQTDGYSGGYKIWTGRHTSSHL